MPPAISRGHFYIIDLYPYNQLPRDNHFKSVSNRGNKCCGRDGNKPSPHNTPRYAPMHAGQAAQSPDTDNRARNRVRGADGNTQERSEENGYTGGRFRAKSVYRA